MVELLLDLNQWENVKKEPTQKEMVIFKFSPTCPVSHSVEREFDQWISKHADELTCLKVDVIRSRPISQHLADEFGVRHESPQVLWLTTDRKVKWSASHGQINAQALDRNL